MKWLHNLLKGASLTTALFIFQACYGTPKEVYYLQSGEAPMSFKVVSHSNGAPLKGIKVFSQSNRLNTVAYTEIGVTGDDGSCHVDIPYRKNALGPYLRFEDPDDLHQAKDTVLYDLREREIVIKMDQKQ
ncbi:MAG: hypothetical protein K6E37_02385 [Bacteroidales bacterium]|nr:hypothetical protein [Bacteroidales bacterium]